MKILFKILSVGALLLISSLQANETFDEVNGNPQFQKFQKYAIDFSERFSQEHTGKVTQAYDNPVKEQDYQEFANLMRKTVIKDANEAMQNAGDFVKRYQIERLGEKTVPFNNPEKEAEYKKFKAKADLTKEVLGN